MTTTIDDIKLLRERTGAGIMDCKQALQKAGGDLRAAEEILRLQGFAFAQKRASRQTLQGLIEIYLHPGGRIGAMVEVNCESDFVARTDVFKELAHNLAMQVAAMSPVYVSQEEIPSDKQVNPQEACLLLQPFIRDQGKQVQDLVKEAIARTGENIRVRRFARFEVGD